MNFDGMFSSPRHRDLLVFKTHGSIESYVYECLADNEQRWYEEERNFRINRRKMIRFILIISILMFVDEESNKKNK